ncbi:hypothetical protein SB2_02850 [Methylobacterium radiotolerans]|nr:hypothetical protein SB3_16495 [Methylobacterium radiotolerans]KTS50476.1 hypothetical protein SB2_02850 [Methylobacterium radiotolerans]
MRDMGEPQQTIARQPGVLRDRWIIPLDRAWAVRSARGIEAEGFDCIAAARHWIEEREAEEADELAAIADCEADQICEAA